MRVQLIGATVFLPPEDVPWEPDERDEEGCSLIEFAGRACYQSWKRPNAATATNAGYLGHILEVKHLSVLEHANVSFYITGVSRSLTHELVRHRHFSYSQLSQRYVPNETPAMVVPPSVAGEPALLHWFETGISGILKVYKELLLALQVRFQLVVDPTLRRKLARQAARSLLPNATETKIVMTGNYRAWRHFLMLRASEHADVEIRALAIAILRLLKKNVPNAFDDFEITALDDGTEVARSLYSPEE